MTETARYPGARRGGGEKGPQGAWGEPDGAPAGHIGNSRFPEHLCGWSLFGGHSLPPSASAHPNLSALCWGLQGGQKEDPANECVCERGAPGAGGGAPEPH